MRKLMLKFITFYQEKISPLSPGRCRHRPTCSTYAKTAYERFSFPKATILTIKRVLTCNPLFKMRYDPVPEKKQKRPKDDKQSHLESK